MSQKENNDELLPTQDEPSPEEELTTELLVEESSIQKPVADQFIAIGRSKSHTSVNKFDRFWLKVWAVICAAVTAISNAINWVIKLIFRHKAPDKYVKAFVSIILIIIAIAILAAPFNITINKIETLDVFSDNLIAVKRYIGTDSDHNPVYKWGYADKKGKLRIPCQYEAAMQFKHGVAWVHVIEQNDENLTQSYWMLIDKRARRVGSNTFMQVSGEVPVKEFSDKIRYAGVNQGGKWGFINTSGKIVIPCIYDEVGNFDEEIARVRRGSNTYFINSKDKTISDEFQDARDFSCGLAAVYRSGNWGFINTKGEIVTELIWDEVSDFKMGYAMIVSRGKDGMSYGIVDTSGKLVLPAGSFVDVALREYFGM